MALDQYQQRFSKQVENKIPILNKEIGVVISQL